MEDAVLRGFAALGILAALACGAVLGVVAWLVARDWWQTCQDLRYVKRMVVQNGYYRPLGDCTCPCKWLNQNPTCQVHGSEEKP